MNIGIVLAALGIGAVVVMNKKKTAAAPPAKKQVPGKHPPRKKKPQKGVVLVVGNTATDMKPLLPLPEGWELNEERSRHTLEETLSAIPHVQAFLKKLKASEILVIASYKDLEKATDKQIADMTSALLAVPNTKVMWTVSNTLEEAKVESVLAHFSPERVRGVDTPGGVLFPRNSTLCAQEQVYRFLGYY